MLRYVERNPLRAGLVQQAEDWRWSSLWQRRQRSPQPLIEEGPVPLPRSWRAHVNAVQTEAELEALRRVGAPGQSLRRCGVDVQDRHAPGTGGNLATAGSAAQEENGRDRLTNDSRPLFFLADLDLDGGTVRIQEKKRAHDRRTSRRVPLSPILADTLRGWLRAHPGGPSLFCQQAHVFRSRKKRTTATPITRDEAHDHFKRTLAGSKWEVLRGYHVLRHSFASNCALKGVDQRLINSWLGHQTEEMVQRYRHLFPTQESEAIRLVFGG